MFCTKCGKQIEEGSKFCQYCGAAQDSENTADRVRKNDWVRQEVSKDASIENKSVWMQGLSALDIGILVIYVVLIIRWTVTFFKGIKYTWDMFRYLEIVGNLIGMLLYIAPYVLILCLTIFGIRSVRKHQYNFSTGIIIVALGLIMKIGTLFFRNLTYINNVVIGWRIFNTYGKIGIFTVVLGILASILLYAKMDHHR